MIRNALARFLYGRYGNNQLGVFLIALYVLLYILSIVFQLGILSLVGDVLLLVALFRMLSRNLTKRREENRKFLRKAEPVLSWYRMRRTIRRDKEHRYFKCPSCGQHLRVPRGKGKITVTCRSCGASFQETS